MLCAALHNSVWLFQSIVCSLTLFTSCLPLVVGWGPGAGGGEVAWLLQRLVVE